MLGQIVRYKLAGLSKPNNACYILCPATQAKLLLMATVDKRRDQFSISYI